ncbi:MAG: response regulator [Candidatus Omnitrophica bacterium]|nr:response regulator [Candidatus Omnitrophota bacterium]
MSKETVLIVEDEKSILELLAYTFEKEGFRVYASGEGGDGLEKAGRLQPSLILLDLMLPGMDGLEILKALRANQTTASIPVIMLTARSEEIDKIVGLELGADDYVTKPFSPRELMARVKAVLRRGRPAHSQPVLRAGAIELQTEKHLVLLKGKPVELTSKEFGLLKVLMESDGRVLSREVLLEKVWGFDRSMHIETRTVDMHVGQLRKKLQMESERILTVKNAGYRFENEK